MRNKKGNIQLITTGVITLLLAAFIFIMGLIILDSLYVNNADASTTVTDEDLTSVDDAGEYVSAITACGFNELTILSATNTSTGDPIDSGNYTVNSRTGLIQFIGDDGNFNGTDWTVNYTYSFGNDTLCEATNETIVGIGHLADYYDLIVLAIVIAVVISLLLIVFSMRRVR